MQPTANSNAPPSRRARRTLTALLILLLILLPLYLWPLRGAMTGPRRAAALPGALLDPRSAKDVARIPGEVWDALLGQTAGLPPASSPKPPHNLTMIAQLDDVAEDKVVDVAAGTGAPPTLPLDGDAAREGSTSAPVEFLATADSNAPGTGNSRDGFGSGGYPGFSGLGPWGGGGPGGPGNVAHPVVGLDPAWNPADPDSLAATPEPTTIALVGSNLTWLGVMAWRRRRRS